MATVSAKVYEHHKKKDGTYNVKIIIYHQDDRKHIDTTHFVSKRQLTPDFEIKDKFLNKIIEDTLNDHRTTISTLGSKLKFFTCEELRDYLRDKDGESLFFKEAAAFNRLLFTQNRFNKYVTITFF